LSASLGAFAFSRAMLGAVLKSLVVGRPAEGGQLKVLPKAGN
jgi:hypothetical protein